MSGIITVFGADAMLTWLDFLKILCLFLLRKNLLRLRLEFIMKFLNMCEASCLHRSDYIQDRMQMFQFR